MAIEEKKETRRREKTRHSFRVSFDRLFGVDGHLDFTMERQESRDMIDEQEEHTIGSLDTSMDRYLENHGLWRKRIPQGKYIELMIMVFLFVSLV